METGGLELGIVYKESVAGICHLVSMRGEQE